MTIASSGSQPARSPRLTRSRILWVGTAVAVGTLVTVASLLLIPIRHSSSETEVVFSSCNPPGLNLNATWITPPRNAHVTVTWATPDNGTVWLRVISYSTGSAVVQGNGTTGTLSYIADGSSYSVDVHGGCGGVCSWTFTYTSPYLTLTARLG